SNGEPAASNITISSFPSRRLGARVKDAPSAPYRTRVRLWDGVETARMPGMAPADPPQSEPGAAPRAVQGQGFERVLGAARVEPTSGWQVHAHEPPPADRHHEATRDDTHAPV